ncbi:hypothetical protein CE195_06055 [Sodalis-like symbiont of Philaenus spumarius]|nr:hypothetical protein CE195_06055 [Sodalis-like symbiont of Philaenus spumarius]
MPMLNSVNRASNSRQVSSVRGPAVLWIARTGSPWRDLPPAFG